jgi:hypothetical protein
MFTAEEIKTAAINVIAEMLMLRADVVTLCVRYATTRPEPNMTKKTTADK